MMMMMMNSCYSLLIFREWLLLKLEGGYTGFSPRSNVLQPELHEVMQEMLIKYVDGTTLGVIANNMKDRNKIQKDVERLKHWDKITE